MLRPAGFDVAAAVGGMVIVREVTCKGIVNRTGGFLSGFTHTINPYHGCAFGKTLCGLPDYAPEIVRTFGETREWGSYLDVKVNAPERYPADHDRIRASARPEMRIYMSSVTDPYVPQERRYGITRRILEAMIDRPPDLLAIQTHTPNPLQDEDLLAALSARTALSVQISVETDREELGPDFPRHAYSVAERIAALERLSARGLATVAVVSPMWPLDDAAAFARRLSKASTYVVLDHYLIGDGSKDGARTRQRVTTCGRAFPALLEEAGWGEWNRLEAFEKVREIFAGILGEARLGVSKEGFFNAAHRLLRGPTEAGSTQPVSPRGEASAPPRRQDSRGISK